MLLLKSCPKCKGDVLLRNDFDGFFVSCIQCGYAKDIQKSTVEKSKAGKERLLAGASSR